MEQIVPLVVFFNLNLETIQKQVTKEVTHDVGPKTKTVYPYTTTIIQK